MAANSKGKRGEDLIASLLESKFSELLGALPRYAYSGMLCNEEL